MLPTEEIRNIKKGCVMRRENQLSALRVNFRAMELPVQFPY